MNIKRVVFFNAAARGDIFIGRGFVKDVIEKILKPNQIDFSYVTCWSDYFTKDLSQKHSRWNYLDGYENEPITDLNPQSKWFVKNDTLYFNTWYCADYKKCFTYYGCSLKTMHCVFSDFYDIFGLKISENLLDYLPKINYMEYNIEKINNHFSTKNKNKKNIFISTSYPRSDQAPTDSLVEMIITISEKYKNCDFYITDNVVSRDNVFYTGNILYEQKFNIETQSDLISSYPMGEYPHCGSSDNKCRNYKNTIDLIECSYFSTFCDVIIGKSTGTYSYSLVDQNIKNNKTKFVGICSLSLASAGLHSIINDKFYSDTKSIEYNLQKNVDLISNVIEEKI